MTIEVIKSRFRSAGGEGDFAWMIEQPQYSRALFLFNDNEEEFYTHFKGGQHRCGIGGGNAGIRPYQCRTPQQAVGIPTGSRGAGYARLDAHVRSVLDDAFSQIDRLLATGYYDSVIFSWDDTTKLGGRIFNTAQDVRDDIVERILATAAGH